MLQITVRCVGDTVAGNGSRNVILRMEPLTQGTVSTNDDWRFTLAPGDPDFDTFVLKQNYTVTVGA